MSRQEPSVDVGTWVKITGFVPGEEEVFHVVAESETDILDNKIPPSNPLARVLHGARAGDAILIGIGAPWSTAESGAWIDDGASYAFRLP